MSPRSLALTLVGTLAAGVLVAAPAQAASYGVTLTVSRNVADVGQVITLKGKVTGAKAARKKLAVSYRLGTGKWSTVKTITTTSKGTYSTRFRFRDGGEAALRVVAPARGKVTKGISPVQPLLGFRWLSLYDEAYDASGYVVRGWNAKVGGTVNGGTPPRETLVMFNNDSADGVHSTIGFEPDELCDVLRTEAVVPDFEELPLHVTLSGAETVRHLVTPGNETAIDQSIAGRTFVSFRREAGDGSNYVILERPRAHCAANRLAVPLD